MEKLVLINSDRVVTIDEADYEACSKIKWRMAPRPHSTPWVYTGFGYKKTGLTEFLFGKGVYVLHKDMNLFNFKRENLEIVKHGHRILSGKRKASQYKGVYFEKRRNKWVAQIFVDGKHKYLGRFDCVEDAARAYNEGAKLYFPVGCYLNAC